ncbi:glycoside hydrolase family protein [Ralstonia syzygii subsp. celebesensis]|uniref:Lysozyme n=2 Tax=Ralstonia syzygii subsp. celebesensis TaxID=1310168 RepID=A0A1U9VFR0_9RALS|nr:glycoside hydrolase family protein [Ralstonia syzygii]AQW29027.1 lysozyme [blood disease bacterium A2-HR MARDI]QQV54430.1 glycoside hydrolase family protein [Ralstonia syzygii subsp. celebesensis]CCA79294.1 lysozyme (lysis protein) (muramidase) (endolysin) [blood disease bacterium R229]
MPFTDPASLGGQNLAAYLDMLSFSEGTDNGRQPTRDHGYDVLVGGGLFTGYADHPRILVDLPRLGIKSTAAGRYQLLARYYDVYKRQLGLADFGPAAQDAIAVQQIRERGALADIKAGRLADAIAKCRNIWASLPGAGYGQHEQKIEQLRAQYLLCGGQEGAA